MRRIMWSSLVLSFVSLVTFSIGEETETSSRRTSTSPHPLPSSGISLKLRACTDTSHFLQEVSRNGVVQIPTLVNVEEKDGRFTQEYILRDHTIDTGNPLRTCRNGQAPVEQAISPTIDEYESEEIPLAIMLRSTTLLSDNGILHVGDLGYDVYSFDHDEFCVVQITGIGIHSTVTFKTCPFENRRILPKCCPLGFYWAGGNCNATSQTWTNKFDPEYLDSNNFKHVPLNKANPFYTSPRIICNTTLNETLEPWVSDCDTVFHPTTDGKVVFLGANRDWEYLEEMTWCIDTYSNHPLGKDAKPILFFCTQDKAEKLAKEEKARKEAVSRLYMVTMYIGATFHFITTLVYLITWPKQNIHGKTLCSCTASLLFMQIFLGTAHLLGLLHSKKQYRSPGCIFNAIGGHYFMIAAFTWLLVVNIDLWRTFRSIRNEGGRHFKRFLGYSALGWGLPLLVVVTSVIMEYSFSCRVSQVLIPEYGEHYCFVAPWAQGIYVYYILGVLIGLSWILAGMTMYGLYQYKKEAVNLRSNKTAEDQQNIVLFLKLTVVMGLSWIFEVVSWIATINKENNWAWIILDLCNVLSSILIFIIFVCKRTTLSLLEQTIPQLKGLTAAISKLSSTFTGDSNSDNNTTSTAAGGVESTRKKSTESQTSGVRYTKEKSTPSPSAPQQKTANVPKQ